MTTMTTADSAQSAATRNQKPRGPSGAYDGFRPLRDPSHEQFAQEIARMPEQDALGKPGEDAYAGAGFARHRRNHVRLMHQERVAKRIEWLRQEREALARAASMPLGKVIEELGARGLDRFADLVDRNAAGVVSVQDFSSVPVEIGIGALKMMHAAFGIKMSVVR